LSEAKAKTDWRSFRELPPGKPLELSLDAGGIAKNIVNFHLPSSPFGFEVLNYFRAQPQRHKLLGR